MEKSKENAIIPMEEYKRLKEVDKEYTALEGSRVFHVNLYTKFMDFSLCGIKDKDYKQFKFTDFNTVSRSKELQTMLGKHMEDVQKFIDGKNDDISLKIAGLEADYNLKLMKVNQKLSKIPKWIRKIFV